MSVKAIPLSSRQDVLSTSQPDLPGTCDKDGATSASAHFRFMDQTAHAALAKVTSGLAPSVLAEAWMDWAVHLAVSPGKQAQLVQSALLNAQSLWIDAIGVATSGSQADATQDRRFSGESWQKYPFNVLAEAHLMTWQWWQDTTKDVHGVTTQHEALMAFVTGQMVDAVAPSNFILSNPDVLTETIREGGQNLVRGTRHLLEDIGRKTGPGTPRDNDFFEIGRNLAATPGKVVYRNDLMELIQYTPQTKTVHPEPILIVPAWIMKYYILDLSSENSLVRFLVEQGFTVFMVSWKNPGAADRDLGMEDYRRHGVMDAIDAVETIAEAKRIHAIGYCLGGTLLSIAASAMARDGDERLATATLFAAQIDFTEAGPLRLFINESEIALIEDMMSGPGYLSSQQMAAAFAMLRSRDLIWAPAIRDYLLGEDASDFDLMFWNADATRMPYRMHSEYLRSLFLRNDLAEGRYRVDDRAITVSDIRAPLFVVGTEEDFVAPWRSVYKCHLLTDTDITFALTSGGHNAGIVSEPEHAGRHFRLEETPKDALYRDPAQWFAETPRQEGSWWSAFSRWLKARSAESVPPPRLGTTQGPYQPLCKAPGTYVMQS